MKLKLDENLGHRAGELSRERGHDVATVFEQGLAGTPDRELIDACEQERRCLVKLDLEFSNPLVFRPSKYPGIAVLRLPSKPGHEDLCAAVEILAAMLAQARVEGKLWIVQRGRVREYQEPGAEDD